MSLRPIRMNADKPPHAVCRHAPFKTAAGAALLAGALAFGGCASSLENQQLRESPGFQAGYVDGCATAQEEEKSFSTRRQRDAYAFDNAEAYRAGWRQGYLECSNTIPEPKDGGRMLGEGRDY